MLIFVDKHIQLFVLSFYAIDQENVLCDEVIHLILSFLLDLLYTKKEEQRNLK